MKLNKLTILAMALVTLAGSGCSSDDYDYGKGDAYGTLSFSLNANNQLNTSIISRADDTTITISDALGLAEGETFTAPAANDFNIVITDPDENEIYSVTIGAYPTDTKLKMANGYKVVATYDTQKVGFYGENGGDPAYTGETTFNITAVDPITVDIPVTMTNSILKFTYTSETEDDNAESTEALNLFGEYFADWSVTVTDTASNTVEFGKEETRGAFLMAVANTISYSLTPAQVDNATAITGSTTVNLKPNTCHIFNFNIKNVGGVNKLDITIDDTTIAEITLDDIDINDDNYIEE